MRGVPVTVGGVSSPTLSRRLLVVVLAVLALGVWAVAVGTAQTAEPPQSPPQTLAEADLGTLQSKAGQGDATAACELGAIYEAGQVVPKDNAEALKWYALGFTLSGDVQNTCIDKLDRLRKQVSAEQRAEGNRREKEWYEAVHFTLPALLKNVKPAYDKDALKAKIKGEVELYAVVGVDGAVTQCRVWQPLDDRLDLEAVKALGQFRFTPATLGDRAVPVVVPVSFSFNFRESK